MSKQIINQVLIETSTLTDWVDTNFYSVVRDLVDNRDYDLTPVEIAKQIQHEAKITSTIKHVIAKNIKGLDTENDK